MKDGRVSTVALTRCLQLVGLDSDCATAIPADADGRLNYVYLLRQLQDIYDHAHNPFEVVVDRLRFFLESNKLTPKALLRRLCTSIQDSSAIPVEKFGAFLKNKIDKKRDERQLREFAAAMDYNRDKYISVDDLEATLSGAAKAHAPQ